MRRQAFIGLILAGGVVAAWLCLQVYAMFFEDLDRSTALLALLLVLMLCWLDVGLFIIAHDAMHGSLAPGRRHANIWVGRVALALYAGFRFERLRMLHMAHHEAPGTSRDPDFSTKHPTRFWPWYRQFMLSYFGVSEFLLLCPLLALYLTLGARLENILLFWAAPALLSSLQLFYFGTFLPHRHSQEPFADEHKARTSEFNSLVSLLTCFHFGYHHEHHCAPHVAWWELPSERRDRAISRSGQQQGRRLPLP